MKHHDEYSFRATRPALELPSLTPSLSRLRVVFAQNRKTGLERSLKSGSRLDVGHLHRIATEDPRIFGRKNVPKARDWFVVVGLDFSGSTTANGADVATQTAAFAIGELLHKMGIRFSMYSHSSGWNDLGQGVEHREIKSPTENWVDKRVQNTLFAQRGVGVNLDGHSMEMYRKAAEAERASDKLILYFTDGEMPASNYNEELEILQRNIEICRRRRINLLGVGYRTDSPKRHGLDTIQYDKPDDIASIVKGLETRLVS